MVKAVLFDFNGTLYADSDINKIAWKKTLDEIYYGIPYDFESFYSVYKSQMNHVTIKEAYRRINIDKTREEIDEIARRKEIHYRNTCRELERNSLVDGAIEVLDYLKENNIPVILVTSSITENVDFYYSHLNLGRWFKKEETVYDSGEYYDKVDMYKEACRRLNVDIKDCVCFEDSPKSLKEAIKAGVPKIIKLRKEPIEDLKEIKQEINNFLELDYSIFE